MADKQTNKWLRSVGVDPFAHKKNKTLDQRIDEGKEKHRKFLQEQKNLEIKRNKEKSISSQEAPCLFVYRNLGESEYSNFTDLLKNKSWDND